MRDRAAIEREIDILNHIKRADDAYRAEQAAERDAVAAMVRRQQGAWVQQQRDVETQRLERERRISDEHQARRQAQAQARQDAQREHGIIRGQLRDKIAELQQQVAAAEAKTNSADDVEAQSGILELAVAERRLAAAQREFAMHMSHMP